MSVTAESTTAAVRQESEQGAAPLLPSHPELRKLHQQIDEIAAEARRLSSDLSDAALNWTPPGNDDPWSVGQGLDHLNKTGNSLVPRMSAAIGEAKARNQTARQAGQPLRFNWMERLFIQVTQPGGKMKMPVPKLYEPDRSGALNGVRVLSDFLTLQERLKALLLEADGLDLERIKITSPASRLARMSLGAWFTATVVHEHYHLHQIARVRETPGFPAA